jgi:methionyl-tRNA synthetase
MLLSVGVELPTKVFVHGYFTVDGQKMSKSIGNVIDPEEVIKKYGTDAVRYYFARHAHPFEDSDFTMEKFHEAYTANLVNGLGNLVSRVMKLAEMYLEGSVGRPDQDAFPAEYFESLENFEFNKAVDYVWKCIGDADQRMTDEAPFKIIKTDKEKGKKIISELAVELYKIARLLNPIMPSTSKVIKEAVVVNKKPENLFQRISVD